MIGPDAVVEEMEAFIEELRVATLLSGCRDLVELGDTRPVVTGKTRRWAKQRRLR
jgi:isopentenyl diphosphate isomerase/L-lactate dehydrogenase-like FMN-dependent dehydrogenase